MFEIEDEDGGTITYPSVDSLLDFIREDIEANQEAGHYMNYEIKMVEMSQEEFDALPDYDE